MDRLSPEIVSMIVQHLYPEQLTYAFRFRSAANSKAPHHSSCALISRQWQYAVERHTFARIRLKSTELEAFETIFNRPGRVSLLRTLLFDIMLPTYGDSRQNFATNNDVFKSAVKKLFQILSRWDDHARRTTSQSGGLTLVLGAKWDVDLQQGPAEFYFEFSKSSAARRYLALEDAELLPSCRVTALQIPTSGCHAVHPSTMCQLAAAMPNLEELNFEFLDPVNKRNELRRSHRIALGMGLKNLRLPKLARLGCHREAMSSIDNHSYECGDLEMNGIDVLNDGLRRLVQISPITHLVLSNCLVSPDLFRDRTSNSVNLMTWPALQYFKVNGGIVAPSGAWYYTGDPESESPLTPSPVASVDSSDSEDTTDSDDDPKRDAIANGARPTHPWRDRPDPSVFNKLVESMTDAVPQMPQLKFGQLSIGLDLADVYGIDFQCADAGQKMENTMIWTTESEIEVAVRRWKVWIGRDTSWTVPTDLVKRWRDWVGSGGKVVVGTWPEPR